MGSGWPDEHEDPSAVDAKTGEVFVEVHVFAELEEDGRLFRVGGAVGRGASVSAAADPTTAHLRIARDARVTHLGNLLATSWREHPPR